MELNPNDLVEILKFVEESKELVTVVTNVMNSLIPEALTGLEPTADAMINAIAGNKWKLYKALQDEGFSDAQSFTLLLDYRLSLEENMRNQKINASATPKINIKKKE